MAFSKGRAVRKEIVKLLLNYRADTNIRNDSNLRSIDIAREFGHSEDILNLLQKKSSTTNSESAFDRR